MDALFNNILKSKIINAMKKYLDDDICELIIDLPLTIGFYHTIEWDESNDDLILHMFDFDFDYPIYFEDIEEEDKLRVYQILKNIEEQ
jgi:hypothetical protein